MYRYLGTSRFAFLFSGLGIWVYIRITLSCIVFVFALHMIALHIFTWTAPHNICCTHIPHPWNTISRPLDTYLPLLASYNIISYHTISIHPSHSSIITNHPSIYPSNHPSITCIHSHLHLSVMSIHPITQPPFINEPLPTYLPTYLHTLASIHPLFRFPRFPFPFSPFPRFPFCLPRPRGTGPPSHRVG